jgi:ribosomal protein S15P/S13E
MVIEKKTKNKEESEKIPKTKEKITQEEYEKKVLELAEKGVTSEKIGETLRKQGIHPKDYDKKISKILGGKYVSPDLKNLEQKLEKIKKHHEKNSQDKRAMREKDRVFSQLRKLKKYLKISK